MERRLAAILAADVVSYTRLMGADETGTLRRLTELRQQVLEPLIAENHGRVVKVIGDGLLVEFASVVAALTCAVAWQTAVIEREAEADEDKRLRFRIGINLGDVIVEDDDIHGDGVNVAARLESLADPDEIWVSGDVFRYAKGKVEADFEDMGEHDLKNVAEPIRIYRIAQGGSGTVVASTTEDTLPLADKPSIAVLPFNNMSGDPEQDYFSDGITEDIITELSRFRSLFVIARNSSFAFRGQQVEIADIARRLGVQYVVEGSVRKAGNRVRITAQLIGSANSAHLWAERYDRELEDVFAVQDDVVRTVVATVAGQVEAAGAQLAKRKPPQNLVAYDYVLRGLEQLSLVGEEHNSEAQRLFQKAVELDPQYAAGHAYLALAIYVQWNYNQDPAELERALDSARRALELDENDSRCHRILVPIYTHMHQYDLAELHSDKSIALNPNDALGAIYRAILLRFLGRAEEGIVWACKAMQLNPYHPNWYRTVLAHVLHTARHYAEALDSYSQITERPSFYHAYVAACHAELGHMDEAQKHVALALQTRPDFSITAQGKKLPFKHEADLQGFLAGLRKAGLPE